MVVHNLKLGLRNKIKGFKANSSIPANSCDKKKFINHKN